MSKSLWSRSVWESFVARVSGSRRLPRARRRKDQARLGRATPTETLEERTVPAAVGVTFSAGTLTLTSVSGNTNEVVTVKAGAAFTDVLVKGQTTTRILNANSANISTIVFNAGGGTGDSLAVSGVTTAGGLTFDLEDVEKLQINASTNVTIDSDTSAAATLKLVTSTVAGTFTLNHEGDVSQSGKLIVSGATTINADDGGTDKDITLKTSSNSFGPLALNGEDITVSEAGPMDLGSSSATGKLTATASGAITSSGLIVNGVATFTSNGSTVSADGAFGSTVTIKKATSAIINDTAGGTSLGKSDVTGSLTVTSAGAVSQSGKLTVGGLATITANAGGSNILLTQSNNFGSLNLTGNDITITEKSSTILAAVDAGGNLIVTSAGTITDSGALDVNGNATFTTKGSDIILDVATSTFGGSLKFTGANVAVTDNDGATDLDASVTKGNLSVTTTGTTGVPANDLVTQTGALTVAGRLTVTATGKDITLDDSSNSFGSVSLFGKDVTIAEANATDLFTSTITGTTTGLMVTSDGAVTDSGTLTVQGDTTITAGGSGALAKSITLDDDESAFTGTLTLEGSNASVLNATATELGNGTVLTGSFSLNSQGAVSGDGGDVDGRLTIDANDADITLTGGTFGSISLTTTGSASITEDDSTDLYESSIGVDFTLETFGAVIDSGNVTVGGVTNITANDGAPANITLNSSGSEYTGAVSLDGAVVSFYNDTATEIGETTATGTLTIVSNGEITNTGTIDVGGKATFDALGHDISIDDDSNIFDLAGGISLFGDNVTLTTGATANNGADGDIALATSNITGTFTLTAAGDVIDIGTIKVADLTSIDATGFDVTLDSALNSFGEIELTADDVIINENDTVELGASTVNSLKVTGTLGIEDTGTLTVAGLAEMLATDGDIVLDETASTFGSLKLTADNIEVTEDNGGSADGTVLDGISTPGDFTLTSQGAVTQTAGISVGGDAVIIADTDLTGAADRNITLTGTNDFGTLTFKGADVSITEASPTVLSPNVLVSSTAAGTLTIVSGGSITADGIVTATGTTDLTAGAAGTEVIDLNNAGNQFGELKLQGGVVTIRDTDAATLLGTTDVGSLTLTASGPVTRGGNLIVDDLLTINASGQNVDLTTGAFTNQLTQISITANSVTLTDNNANGTAIVFLNVAGDFTLTSTGDVTGDTVDITIAGVTTITATGDIVIDPTFGGAVNLTGDDIELIADGGLTLGNITATGDVTITATGNVANLTTPATGKLDIDGVLTINAGANDVTLNIRDTESNLTQPINPANITAGNLTTTIPTATITFNAIAGDNIINATESGSDVTVSGTVALGNGVEVGDKVTLTLVDGATTDNFELTIGVGGTFTVDIPFAKLNADDDLTVDARITTPDFGAYAPTGSATYTVDTAAPSLTITPNTATVDDAVLPVDVTFTFQFSETVTGFVVGDILIAEDETGGVGSFTVGAFNVVDGDTYTLVVTVNAGSAVGYKVTADVAANVAQDAAGNDNTVAAQAVVTVV